MSNGNETWGAPIKVDGKRPVWLKDDDKCEPTWLEDGHYGNLVEAEYVAGWENVTSIRLPADHWAYTAINAGFEPWAGGDAAPDDWDGNKVLLRKEEEYTNPDSWVWDFYKETDIIGYKKRTETNSELVNRDAIKIMSDELHELRAFKAKALERYPDLGPETPEMIIARIVDEWAAGEIEVSGVANKAFNAGREYERINQ